MVVEFAQYGNLREFLRKRPWSDEPGEWRQTVSAAADDVIDRRCPPLRYEILVSFAYQVARGLEYLSLKSVGDMNISRF